MGQKVWTSWLSLFAMLLLTQVSGQGYPGTKQGTRQKLQVPPPNTYAAGTGTQGLGSPLGKVPDTITGCYTGDQYWPSVRLPNSLDNLVFIVEKIEDSFVRRNMSIAANFMANLILRRFQVNGIMDTTNSDTKIIDQNEQIKQDMIFRLLANVTAQFPEDSLTDKEKCALHWMISTSINVTNLDPYNTDQQIYDDTTNTYTIVDFPRENGAIYTGKYGTLSGGPLLSGIAASSVINNNMKVQDLLSPDQYSLVDSGILSSSVDPLYIATLAGEIGQSAVLYSYPQYTHAVFGPSGTWNNTVCPTTLSSVDKYTTAATKAELMGATDGLIIGNYLRNTYFLSSTTIVPSLSQVLRSYYGRGLEPNNYYGCDRTSQANQLVNSLTSSAVGFATAYKIKGGRTSTYHQLPDGNTQSYVSQAVGNFSQTYLQSQEFQCDTAVQNTLCQTLNDIIVVMDTNINVAYDTNFQEQKNFIGSLIQRVGVFPNSSHVGIVSFGSNREPVPFNPTQSGAEVRCLLQWAPLYGSSSDVSQTIRFVQDKFRTIRNLQRNSNAPQAGGKVVIFIYLQNSLPNADQVKQAMRELRAEFPDVTSLAVGKKQDVLKNFVVQDSDIFSKAGDQLSINVDAIVSRLCTVPATIEYKYCNNPSASTEQSLVAEDFVYQDTYQWLAIHPWTMNRSQQLTLRLESKYGSASFCVSRSITTDATGNIGTCHDTSPQDPLWTYGPFEPCGDDAKSCQWLYIRARGRPGSSTEKCSERACDSVNQVKVSVTHSGLKCDGTKVTSTWAITSFSFLFLFFVKYNYS